MDIMMNKGLLVFIASIIINWPGNNCTEFMVMYPSCPDCQLMLVLTTAEPGPTAVDVIFDRSMAESPISTVLGGTSNDFSQMIKISTVHMMNETGKHSQAAIRVISDGDITVHTTALQINVNKFKRSAYSLLVLPVSQLSTYYVTFNYCTTRNCFLVVGSPFNDVSVEIHLMLSDTTKNVSYNGKEYVHGSTVQETLNAYDSMQILTYEFDLMGTRVLSSRPVAVVAGNEFPRFNGSFKGAMVEQMPPVESLGRDHVIGTTPQVDDSMMVFVVFTEAHTQLTYDTARLRLDFENSVHARLYVEQTPVTISANANVMVFQTLLSHNADDERQFDQALTLVMPINTWSQRFVLPVKLLHTVTVECNVSIVIYTFNMCSGLHITLERTEQNKTQLSPAWQVVGWFQVGTVELPTVTAGRVLLTSDICRFGGYMTGLRPHIAWANPLGWHWNPIDFDIQPSSQDPSESPLMTVFTEIATIVETYSSILDIGSNAVLPNNSLAYTPTLAEGHTIANNSTIEPTTVQTSPASSAQVPPETRKAWEVNLCQCPCSKQVHKHNVSQQDSEALRVEIEQELRVEKSDVSAWERRRVSAENAKTSHVYLGSLLALSVFLIVISIIVLPDLYKLSVSIYTNANIMMCDK